jgi:hypothetical protein
MAVFAVVAVAETPSQPRPGTSLGTERDRPRSECNNRLETLLECEPPLKSTTRVADLDLMP